ncbi:MAG: glycoside hydrolase 43 family protein, partial [Janthinobacterium lividum]
ATQPGQLALAAVPAPPEAPNLYLVPSLLLQKLPAEQFTATARLSGQGLAPGERTGLVVLGLDYATLSLTRQADGRLALAQTGCPQADKGAAETTAATAPPLGASQPLYLRVAVRAGGRCQFSYSTDGRQYLPLGPEFVAREGRWVGAKVGLFCLGASAAAAPGYAAIDWWRVAP